MLSRSGARVLQLQDGLIAWAFGAQHGVSFAGFVLPVKARVPHGRPSLFHGLLHPRAVLRVLPQDLLQVPTVLIRSAKHGTAKQSERVRSEISE